MIFRTATCGVLLLVLGSGCAHAVVLDTQPEGAEIEVDGQLLGTTPVAFTDRAGIERSYTVSLTKPGFQRRMVSMTQQVKPGTLVGAFCCPPLFLVSWELPEDRYTWVLEPDRGEAPAPPPGFLPPASPQPSKDR